MPHRVLNVNHQLDVEPKPVNAVQSTSGVTEEVLLFGHADANLVGVITDPPKAAAIPTCRPSSC